MLDVEVDNALQLLWNCHGNEKISDENILELFSTQVKDCNVETATLQLQNAKDALCVEDTSYYSDYMLTQTVKINRWRKDLDEVETQLKFFADVQNRLKWMQKNEVFKDINIDVDHFDSRLKKEIKSLNQRIDFCKKTIKEMTQKSDEQLQQEILKYKAVKREQLESLYERAKINLENTTEEQMKVDAYKKAIELAAKKLKELKK